MEEKQGVDRNDQADGRSRSPTNIHFGPFELDIRTAELRKEGHCIRLQEQPFQILHMLLESPGEVVLREEIRQKLWPGGIVVEFDHSINAAVKRLRDALLDSAERPRYIETLARRGYRFIGKVEAAVQQEPDTLTVRPCNVEPVLETITTSGANGAFLSERVQLKPPLRSTRILSPRLLAAVIVLVIGGVYLFYRSRAPVRWAREVALPEATRLLNAGENSEAFPFLYRALQILPGDAELQRLRRGVSYVRSIETTPSGANVQLKSYGAPDSDWLSIGQSPIKDFLLPVGYYRWRITKPGFETLEAAASVIRPSIDFKLYPEHTAPPEMVHVPSGRAPVFSSQPLLADYLIDTHEVTNSEFKRFIEHGGYENQRFWRHEFVKDGRVLSWAEAMEHFRDSTGRAGPSTWEVGDYPTGLGDFPVSGVSWYEANAYAEFAKTQLPTIYHWYRAADQGVHSDILKFSNFDGRGLVRVGSRPSLGAFGTYDIAGNVKEWCLNATGDRRYILGGSWNEGRSYFAAPDALPPFNRSSENGFRCVRLPGRQIPDELNEAVDKPKRDYRTETPVSDDVFRLIQSFYAYDEIDLNAKQEAVDDSSPHWRVEKITFDAAYDRQRVIAFLYLPKNAKPPFQTVLFCPSAHGRVLSNIDEAEMDVFDFLMRSGRAVLFTVAQGMFTRRHTMPRGPNGERDLVIQQFKDMRRSLDYLVSRTDILPDRIGLFGTSGGARLGLITLAQESRIRVAILAQGGFSGIRTPPETDGINFAPRVRVPVLMLNGRYDFVFPIVTGQVPMLRLLGSSDKDKRNVLFDTGHAGATKPLIKETLNWLDLYLGPPAR